MTVRRRHSELAASVRAWLRRWRRRWAAMDRLDRVRWAGMSLDDRLAWARAMQRLLVPEPW
jgi:hypothetical protein